ncbi:hypothetical protein EJB05_52713, partial [Eragrostis curvula]
LFSLPCVFLLQPRKSKLSDPNRLLSLPATTTSSGLPQGCTTGDNQAPSTRVRCRNGGGAHPRCYGIVWEDLMERYCWRPLSFDKSNAIVHLNWMPSGGESDDRLAAITIYFQPQEDLYISLDCLFEDLAGCDFHLYERISEFCGIFRLQEPCDADQMKVTSMFSLFSDDDP